MMENVQGMVSTIVPSSFFCIVNIYSHIGYQNFLSLSFNEEQSTIISTVIA